MPVGVSAPPGWRIAPTARGRAHLSRHPDYVNWPLMRATRTVTVGSTACWPWWFFLSVRVFFMWRFPPWLGDPVPIGTEKEPPPFSTQKINSFRDIPLWASHRTLETAERSRIQRTQRITKVM